MLPRKLAQAAKRMGLYGGVHQPDWSARRGKDVPCFAGNYYGVPCWALMSYADVGSVLRCGVLCCGAAFDTTLSNF